MRRRFPESPPAVARGRSAQDGRAPLRGSKRKSRTVSPTWHTPQFLITAFAAASISAEGCANVHNRSVTAEEEVGVLYMVIERFRNQDPVPVYRRFRDFGRLAPDGLHYVSSWVDERLATCFQVMETEDRRLLDDWMAAWSDLVEFEVHPVLTSGQATGLVAPRL